MFEGKLALVTGGTRGIGEQIVEDLNAAKAKLIVIGKDRHRCTRFHRKFTGDIISADLSDPTPQMFDILSREPIDILINNAGMNKIDDIDEINPEDLDQILSLNLRTPMLLTSLVAKGMKKRRYGRIVNISSVFGLVSREKRSAYTASKFGIKGLTVTSAIELAPYNIMVNTVSPGFIETDMTRSILSQEERDALVDQIPCGRLGTPKDISRVVMFLCSEENQYLTGQNLIVDGGFVNV